MKIDGRINPLKFSRNEISKIKQRKIAAFMPILAGKRDEVKRKGHGGSLTADRFQNNETVIATGRYNKKKDTTKLSEIDIMSAMNAVIAGDDIYIMPSAKVVLNNPLEEDESALKATEAVERFESSELSRRLFPDMAKIDQAKRMDEAGTFRTMAEITSGFKAPSSRPIKVRGSTDKRIRAQIQGFKPSNAEILSSRRSRELRNTIRERIFNNYQAISNLVEGSTTKIEPSDIENWLNDNGIDREKLVDGLLKGYEKYIDRTNNTQKDFARIISAYHQTRLNNIPYLQKLAPQLDDAIRNKNNSGFADKFLNSISPTALNMTEAHPIHLIVDTEQSFDRDEFKPNWLRDLFLGEIEPEDGIPLPAFIEAEAQKSSMRLLASFRNNQAKTAEAIVNASAKAFDSTRGMIDIGFSIGDARARTAITQATIAKSLDAANTDRLNGDLFDDLFGLEGDPEEKRGVMENLVKMGLAFKITDGFYLVPLFSGGFRKQPKGWSSKWVVPTIQILDEYAEAATDPESKISGLDLLFIIAARAKSLYNYDLKEAETVLLYTMLDPLGGGTPAEEAEEEEEEEEEASIGARVVSRASIIPGGATLTDEVIDQTKLVNFFKRISEWSNEQEEKKKDEKDKEKLAEKARKATEKARKEAAAAKEKEKGKKKESKNTKEIVTGEEAKETPSLFDNAKETLAKGEPTREEASARLEEMFRGHPKADSSKWLEAQIGQIDELLDQNEGNWAGFLEAAKKKFEAEKAGAKKNPQVLPSSLIANDLGHAKALQDMVAAEHGKEYVIMQKGNQFIVTSPSELKKATKKGFQAILEQNTGFSKEFVEANARGPVKNPMTAECQECGHRQELKNFSDKCEKCGSQGKWKSGNYTKRKASHSCSYRKTKRSKECGGRVTKMKNGRIYKCEDCGAKYQMR